MSQAATRYCDLVMKGGITSGIVYPNAVLALARDFRFKNIGGTSAGAIAAAATAAAALGDRKHVASGQGTPCPPTLGFAGLERVAAQLSSQGFIFGLFQPARGGRNAYRLIVTLAGNASAPRKVFAAAVAVVAIAPLEAIFLFGLFLALGYGVAGPSGIAAVFLPSAVCAYLGAAIAAALRVARVTRRNLLGLCSGLSGGKGKEKPALTEWLHDVLQSLSGKVATEPLLFDDLWNAPRYPGEPATETAISLQMITTGVSHHEPRTLPFTDASFWFLRDEFDLLFPQTVVDAMVAMAGKPDRVDGKDYYRLPGKGRMPVLVAMRMSLSFPLLISAVPLHEPTGRRTRGGTDADVADDSREAKEANLSQSTDSLTTGGEAPFSPIEGFRICWFTDGGVSSNFPLHLFDAPLPRWPTFAINLVYPQTDDAPVDNPEPQNAQDRAEAAVWLPLHNNRGWQRSYNSIARPLALAEVSGFLFGIIGTMQNWRDLLQSRAPGQRDRIVHVALDKVEGGMNLDMSQDILDSISLKGTVAGERLYQFSFDNHVWVRWRNVASGLQRYTVRIAASAKVEPPILAYQASFATVRTGTPPPVSYKFRSAEAQGAAQKLYADLVARGEEWADLGPDLGDGTPRPLPQMQITPIY
ncbi:Patatin-like phospholipase [Sphingopyxis sp. YR583]|uniref:patatin-like phospholipase family protein n=1 Tax=Sphingopyxis sp. YR583 TaxID=1881047 RepID=UPI0008A811A3|nr:patatin-like phospholipase family protein [Sphingopyxis sp. YR583]SEH10689.1 Patatin-like phospholipase [Sphingopyxis sp. YR583]